LPMAVRVFDFKPACQSYSRLAITSRTTPLRFTCRPITKSSFRAGDPRC
jgi:hypothetical protein